MANKPTYEELEQRIKELEKNDAESKRVEQLLRESEEMYRSLVDRANDGILLIQEGVIKYTNPRMAEIVGYPVEHLIGTPFIEHIHPDEISTLIDRYEQRMSGETIPPIYETIIKLKDGSNLHVEINASIITYQGEPADFAIIRDITGRKQAEQALRESEEKYRTILESIEDGYYEIDLTGNFTFLNDSLCKIGGYSKDEVLGMNSRKFMDKENAQKVYVVFNQVYVTGKPTKTSNHEILNKDGSKRYVEVSISLRKNKEGQPIGYRGIMRDVTDRKYAEEALRESEEKYRYLVENINDVIYSTDNSGVITYISPAIEAVLGYRPQEAIGRHITDYVFEEDLSLIKKHFQEALDGKLGPSEHRLQGNSGETHWVRSSGRPIVENNRVVGLQGVFVDISKRKQAENELSNSREQLRNLTSYLQSARETERKSIAREIHDELGPALTGLKMDLSWLSEKIPKEEQLLKKIQAMINLTDININTVRRISAELRPGTLDVLGLVAALEWQAEEFQNRTGIKCNISTDPEEISLDDKLKTDIFRIFQEILTNVARHAQATKVTASFIKKNEYLELKVRDNGKGITAEQISDPTSFGLIGIRERVYPWRGNITIRGGPNGGTTVTVRVQS